VKVLRFPVSVGDSSFTLMGLLSAALILFFTHLLIRLWRHVLSTGSWRKAAWSPACSIR
jgi:small-conductance mechanosensitive channel